MRSICPADDKRPQFRAWCHRQAFWEPKGKGKANLTFFMLQIALRARDRGRPDKPPRAHSPPRQPLGQWPHIRVPRVRASTARRGTRGRSSAALSRQVTRRARSFFFGAIRVPVPKPHRQARPLQTEAGNAKKALETTIPGVLRIRPPPIDSVLGPIRFSSARTPLPVSSVLAEE